MRRGLGIAVIIAVLIGLTAVILRPPEKLSAEGHLKAYYAAKRKYHMVLNIGRPTLGKKVVMRWYKLIGKDEVEFLNQMGKHRTALEDLGYLETQAFVVSNRSVLDVHKNLGTKGTDRGINGLVNIWPSGTNRIYVLAPKADLPKWEDWIRQADAPE